MIEVGLTIKKAPSNWHLQLLGAVHINKIDAYKDKVFSPRAIPETPVRTTSSK